MIAQLFGLISARRELSRRTGWDRAQLDRHRERALRALRDHAYANSPFYRRFHRGLEGAPLEELPVLTKSELMRSWDDLVTDRAARLSEVKSFISQLQTARAITLYRDRYYAVATSGSTGLRGIFIYDWKEWSVVLSSYLRILDLAGIGVFRARGTRTAIVGTTSLWHQSALIAATLRGLSFPIVAIDSVDPLEKVLAQLNEFRPGLLVAYANMAKLLAQQQLAGKLRIAPQAVFGVSEVLTAETRRLIRGAWQVEPFDVYGATETAGIASECQAHRGMHVYEDQVIIEPVDRGHRPVPPGQIADKLLATVLFSRTVPLVRYEISDSLRLSPDHCICHCPFVSIAEVQGRMEDVLQLPGGQGRTVEVQPNVFHRVMDEISAGGWQIVQERDDRLKVLVEDAGPGFDRARLIRELTAALREIGVSVPAVEVEHVSTLTRGALGKTQLIRSMKGEG